MAVVQLQLHRIPQTQSSIWPHNERKITMAISYGKNKQEDIVQHLMLRLLRGTLIQYRVFII